MIQKKVAPSSSETKKTSVASPEDLEEVVKALNETHNLSSDQAD